jgi:hypothetical protein
MSCTLTAVTFENISSYKAGILPATVKAVSLTRWMGICHALLPALLTWPVFTEHY